MMEQTFYFYWTGIYSFDWKTFDGDMATLEDWKVSQ